MAASNLVYRHNRITRLTHWLNALALMILLMSGLMIFNAHPHLYWGHTSEPDKALLSIGATERGGETRGYLEVLGTQINTTGVLGRPAHRQRHDPTSLSELGYRSGLLFARRRAPLAFLFRLAVQPHRARSTWSTISPSAT